MKRKIYGVVITSFCLFVILTAFSQNKDLSLNINQIQVHPGTLNTRVILESDTPLAVGDSGYSNESPRTLVIDLGKTEATPKIAGADPQCIEELKIDRSPDRTLRLSLILKEAVPYRIFTDQKKTVIELNKIQRGQEAYTIEADVQKELARKANAGIVMRKVDIAAVADQLSVKARLSGQALSQVFALGNPLRLVIDLYDTQNVDPVSVYPVRKCGVEKVRVAQFKSADPHSITRMVFDLAEPRLYALNSDKDGLLVTFSNGRDVLMANDSKPEKPVSVATPVPVPPAPENSHSGTSDRVPPELQKEDNAKRTVQTASAENTPAKQPQQAAPSEPKPLQKAQPQEDKFKPKIIIGAEERYTGDIITLKFKDADLRDVILYLGDFANLNVIFDPEVRGVVTCNLVDVPWDQALDILLKNNKLGKTIEGNVLRVAPIDVLTREDEEQRKLRESKELAGPVQVKTITLSYSKAKDVQALLSSKKSTRGEIIIDDRTNTLIISDVKENLELLEKLISVLDTPTPQVSIEARIVEANSTFVRNLGIQWGYRGISDPFYGNQSSLQFPNKILADGAMIPKGESTKGIGGPLGGYAVNLPAPAFSTAVGFSMANILDTFRIDVALSALETSGEGRIISSPKVTTQNNQGAEIIQGRQIPVQTVANFTVTVRYVNAALELRATPQITAEGTIIMMIEIQNNAADFANLVNGIPPITTQSARTTVMIPDGGTTVIGGIYRTEDSITREKVPFLHQIPILGSLFRSFARTRQNRELLIFITPRIIK